MDAARTIGRSISVFAIASVLMVSCALPCELSSIHECQLLSYVENVEGSERGLGATRIDIADVLGASYFSTERGCALPVNVRIGMQEGMPVERVSFRPLGEGFTVGASEDTQSDVLTLPYESLEGVSGREAIACFVLNVSSMDEKTFHAASNGSMRAGALRLFGESGFAVSVIYEDGSADECAYRIIADEAFLDAVERDETAKYQGLRFRVVKLWLPAHVQESL